MRIYIALAIALLILFTACAQMPTGKIVNEEPIKIGFIASLTGGTATQAEYTLKGVSLAVDELNSKEGIKGRRINLIVEDDQCDPKIAVSAIEKLINIDKPAVIIGPSCSSSVIATAPIAEKSGTIIMTTIGSSPKITHAGDYIFRNTPSGALLAEKIAEFAINNYGAKNASILYLNMDNGVDFKEIFKKRFEQLGGRILNEEAYERGTKDFRTQLFKIKEKAPQIIFIGGQEHELAVKQIRELGIQAQIMGPITMETDELIRVAGKAAEGVIYTAVEFEHESKEPMIKEYQDKFMAKYGKPSEIRAATAYDAVMITARAMANCNNPEDTVCIKKELYNTKNYPGISGVTTFDENGDVIKPIMIKTVKDGKFVRYEE